MLLERFGLWEARNERVATFSRGMLQRLALCRDAPARARRCSCSTSRSRRSTPRAPSSSTASSPSCAGAHRRSSPRTTPSASSRSRPRGSPSHERLLRRRRRARAEGPPARAALARHAAGDAALRRLGARRLPLRAAGRLVGAAPRRAALGRDRLHGAARPRPRVRRRARERRHRRARARAVRPQRDLARRRRSARLAFLVLAELVALPAFALFFHGSLGARGRGRAGGHRDRAVGTLLGGDGRREPRARAAPAAALPAARDPDRDRRRRRERGRRTRPLPRLSRVCTTLVFAILCWASFEYVVTE